MADAPVPDSLLSIVLHHEARATPEEVRRMAAELQSLRAAHSPPVAAPPATPVAPAPQESAAPTSIVGQQFSSFLDGNGHAPTEDGWPKLERPAALHTNGGATFGKGVSSRLLVKAAYRNYERTEENRRKTPAQRVEDERQRRALWDMVNGPLETTAQPQPQPAQPLTGAPWPSKGLRSPDCWCGHCDRAANQGWRSRMSLCPNCGDKRCPRAENHENQCTAPSTPPEVAP